MDGLVIRYSVVKIRYNLGFCYGKEIFRRIGAIDGLFLWCKCV